MSTVFSARPAANEHVPYFGTYISQVADGDIRATLRAQVQELSSALAAIPEASGDHAYGPGKWTIKEVILHLADAERVFSYRLLRIARGDTTPLPGFDQDLWVPNCDAARRTVASVVAELLAVRGATLTLVDSLSEQAFVRVGNASGKDISARALAWISAGHCTHHLKILRERYLA